MKKSFFVLASILLVAVSSAQPSRHKLHVRIVPAEHSLTVNDTLVFYTGEKSPADVVVSLNSSFELKSLSPDFTIRRIEQSGPDAGNETLPITKYSISHTGRAGNSLQIPLYYTGKVYEEISDGAADYARGFSETNGIVFDAGVYLAGSTAWVPWPENSDMASFELSVTIPRDWSVVSQGNRTLNLEKGEERTIKYDCEAPMDEIYLIGAKWTEYSLQAGNVLVQAFLRTPDSDLANKYMHATRGYIDMYAKLIGPYPYTKFALVENFWETGYGMPSFTLLGEKIIRFPWILYTSYPHELLHNYWGNSVFVDYRQGNWCEGITVYMADHMLKEQQGQGMAYRQSTLRNFTDYVNDENDFPVSMFSSRQNSATEAIGYGKSMMINHMLRVDLGDSLFIRAWAVFYKFNKFRKASFDDIRKSFEEVSGRDLSAFFKQWIGRKGAPEISLRNVECLEKNNGFELRFKLMQTQKEDVFDLNVPVAIFLEDTAFAVVHSLTLNSREQEYTMQFRKRPLKIEADPLYDVFRRLDKNEMPTSLSQIFGSRKCLIVLPGKSPFKEQYAVVAGLWKSAQAEQNNEVSIVLDSDLEALPDDKSVWIFGYENSFADAVRIPQNYKSCLSDSIISKMEEVTKSGAFVYVIPNPRNNEYTTGFLGAGNAPSIEGLSRKLSHYGKYGFLGFMGEAPDNVLKGVFPTPDSPLKMILNYKTAAKPSGAILKEREALIN